jgi:hypothetical protein
MKGLVESSFSQALFVKRDRKDQVKALRIPILRKPLCHPFPKNRTETDFPLIFPTMDRLLQRPLIMSQCPCHCKIFPLRHTSATGMAIHLGWDERGPTDGAKGRGDPADFWKAIRTKPFLSFFEIGFTAETLSGKKKLKKFFKKRMHSFEAPLPSR